MFFRFTSLVVALLACTLGASNAEGPFGRNIAAAAAAPYPAAGYRPSRPFNLPRDYLPPTVDEFEPQQQRPQYDDARQQQAYDIEIRKQRVDFVGQVQGNALVHDSVANRQTNRPHNAYLPPATNEFLKVQELPQPGSPQQFVQAPPPPTPPPATPQRQFNQRPQQQQDFFPQNVDVPAQEYGAPELPEPRQLQADVRLVNGQQEENRAAIEALNAAAEAYNRRAQASRDQATPDADGDGGEDQADYDNAQDERTYPASKQQQQQQQQQRDSRFTQGQYYVLGPDNTVQRVMFSTTQDEQDQRNNGFTAKLRYTPVGEVRDPVFKYNNQGQLVRLFK